MSWKNNQYCKSLRQFLKTILSKKTFVIIISTVFVLAILLFGGYHILKSSGKNALKKNVTEKQVSKTIMQMLQEKAIALEDNSIRYNGITYKYNKELITILCMGIDTSENRGQGNVPGKNGQADAIFLLLVNEKDKTIKLINVPRDIIAEVQEYDKYGMPFQRVKEQIALQFSYGDGKEQSCELMKSVVSEILYGLPINAYVAINMDAIGILNDQVGGVTVTIEGDFTAFNRAFKEGTTLTLSGKQAMDFVQMRDVNVTGSNLIRIGQQKQYLNAFTNTALAAIKADMSIPIKMFQSITQYMTTDIAVDEVVYLAEQAISSEIDITDIQLLPGEYQKGELYDEYVLDDIALYEMILQNFYIEVP